MNTLSSLLTESADGRLGIWMSALVGHRGGARGRAGDDGVLPPELPDLARRRQAWPCHAGRARPVRLRRLRHAPRRARLSRPQPVQAGGRVRDPHAEGNADGRDRTARSSCTPTATRRWRWSTAYASSTTAARVLRGAVALNHRTADRMLVVNLPGKGTFEFRLRLPAEPHRAEQFGPWHLADRIASPADRQRRAAGRLHDPLSRALNFVSSRCCARVIVPTCGRAYARPMSEFRLTQISDTHLGRRFPGLIANFRSRQRAHRR